MKNLILFACAIVLFSCKSSPENSSKTITDSSLYSTVQTGGVKVFPIETPKGKIQYLDKNGWQ